QSGEAAAAGPRGWQTTRGGRLRRRRRRRLRRRDDVAGDGDRRRRPDRRVHAEGEGSCSRRQHEDRAGRAYRDARIAVAVRCRAEARRARCRDPRLHARPLSVRRAAVRPTPTSAQPRSASLQDRATPAGAYSAAIHGLLSGARTMRHLCFFVGTLMIASACASQGEGSGKSLVEASKLVKVNLVDAVQSASKVLDGRVVGATLDPKQRGRPAGAYAVLVVHDGKLWTVDVDAQSGIAGKPRVVADDDDDDDDAKGEKKEAEDMKANKSEEAASGKVTQGAKLGFEDVPVGALPQGWRAAETAGRG